VIADVEVEQVALFHFIAGVAVVDVLPAAHDIAYRVTGDGIHLYAYPLCLNGFCYNRLSGLLGFAVHRRIVEGWSVWNCVSDSFPVIAAAAMKENP